MWISEKEENLIWRIFYRVDSDAIVVVHWFVKKTRKTAKRDLDLCKERLKAYDRVAKKGGKK